MPLILLTIQADMEKSVLTINTDGGCVYVPFEFFGVSGDGIAPDFNRISIVDEGLTLRLGEYECDSECFVEFLTVP